MFYNYCRSTKAAALSLKNQKKFKSKQKSMSHSPSQRLLNLNKRQKLKHLLLMKFMEKYNLNYPDQNVEKEVSDFVQGEKLTDRDLQRLNYKIQRLVRNSSAKRLLEKTMNKKLDNSLLKDMNNYDSSITNVKLFSPKIKTNPDNFTDLNNINNNTINNNNLNQKNEVVSLPIVNENKEKEKNDNENKTLKHSQSAINIANNTFSIFPKYSYYNKKIFKSPEEELAELEKELEIKDYCNKDKREKKFEFRRGGNEWNAISKYKQKLYHQQLIEQRIKENEMKKRTKEDLDNQIKTKIQKEQEENIKEKEFNDILNEKLKRMDEVDKIRNEKIRNQMLREKESRDKILKEINTRKKIEFLKNRKLDNEIINTEKKLLEKELTARYMKKKIANEALNQQLKEIELKKIKLKELYKRQKEDEITLLKERQKMEDKKENEKKKFFDKIYYNANKFILKNAEEIIAKNKEEQKKEDEKIEHYIEEKRKAMEEKELKEKIKKNEQKKELKKFLDMQIEEKKKEQIFLKKLDYEQARIWNMDCQRYHEDSKIIDNRIRNMQKKNFEYIIKQINENSQRKLRRNNSDMTYDEYEMNKDLIEKAKNSFLNEKINN